MRGVTKIFAALLVGVALVAATAAPASAAVPVFRKYVACGVTDKAKPSHFCKQRQRKGAFFRSTRADVRYSVCVFFPSKRHLCARGQQAEHGQLYVNRVRSNIVGRHLVLWFVKGKRVGRFVFIVTPNQVRNGNRNRNRRR